MRQGSWVVAVTLVLSGACVDASGQMRDPIVTDRPDFTEASIVVGKGMTQLETGFTFTNERGGTSSLFLPEALLRVGISPRWEWRLGLPNLNWAWSGGGAVARGFGDTYIGAKVQLGPTPDGTDISLIPAAFVPTGQRSYSSRAFDPEIKVCLSRELGPRHTLSGMIYFSSPSQGGRRNFTTQTTLSLGTSFTERLSLFTEYAGTFFESGRSIAIGHVGLVYLVSNDVQLDLHGGFGLGSQSPHSLIAAGFSIRR